MESIEGLEIMDMEWIGTSPLLLRNGRLADPAYVWSKAIKAVASKRKKTDEDLEELRWLDWRGSLYLDENDRIVIPADNVLGCLIAGAKKDKNGLLAKAGIMEAPGCPWFTLEYDGPKDIKKLYDDERFVDYRPVGVQRSKVMRSRPIFQQWSVKVSLQVETGIIDTKTVELAARQAGRFCALGDFRPRYGRFEVKV
jgi:hypothetical protein